MKRIATTLMPVIFLGISLAFFSCQKRPDRVELTDWQFEYQDHWYPATVPGFIHTDLMANGLIPDPYYGTNEDSVQWVGKRGWKYRTTIPRDLWESFEQCELVLEGVTYCDVWLKGETSGVKFSSLVLTCDNMFREYRVSLSDIMVNNNLPALGDNTTLEITFYPIEQNNEDHFATEVSEIDGYPCPDMEYDLPDHRVMSRMAPYMLGWDWGPKLSAVGIWKPVYITNIIPPSNSGLSRISRKTKVELRQEQDSIGQSFTFYRDGKPLFIKGANWIPVHSFPVDNKANRDRYRLLLTSAKEAGFNMLRVWGGGIYEHDYFFDLCDSLDLMVWMDFNFSCALYPSDTTFLANVKTEAEQQVRRIAKHPCVVLWCGNNEVKNGWEDWGWQGVYNWTSEQRDLLQHGIDTIFGEDGILAHSVRDCDPLQRPYITTSPLYGWGHPECVTHGDSHYWGVWWGEEPFEKYAEKTGRFMSEYGFQSYPMISTLRQFCPEGQLHIDSPTLRSHQKHPRGREIIDKAMRQYYGFDSKSLSLEDYCYVSQLLQAWGTGYGIYQHIKQQPHCMGTLYWQLNDCWPVASWSSIDYYGNWKALHYRVKALYADNVNLNKWEQYYSVYPKDRTYPDPKYKITQAWESDGTLVVTIKAETDLYDVYIETYPHINGHFTNNFFDLHEGEKMTIRFVPTDPSVDMHGIKVSAKTLNELYFYRK